MRSLLPISIDNIFMTIQRLRQMHPEDFELFIKLLFSLKGYQVKLHAKWETYKGIPHPIADGGIDLEAEKDHDRAYIQVKKQIRRQVGINLMKHLYASVYDNNGTEEQCLIITTSLIHRDAQAYGRRHHMVMRDYEKLLSEIHKLAADLGHKQQLEQFINSRDYTKNSDYLSNASTCKRCYAPLVRDTIHGGYICMRQYEGCTYSTNR